MNNTPSCEFAHDDAAYVLGALSPADRVAFERHLGGCAHCSRAVQELAGMPGLLARISAETLESPPLTDPVPDTLLPSLVKQVRRNERRRTWVTAGLAAAAALVVATGAVAATNLLGDDDASPGAAPPATSSSATAEPGQVMAPVGGESITGNLALKSVAWGTKLDLTCSYLTGENDPWGEATDATYAMVVRTREGKLEQVATWHGLPGKTMHLGAATATRRADIAEVEVRTSSGKPVLKLVG